MAKKRTILIMLCIVCGWYWLSGCKAKDIITVEEKTCPIVFRLAETMPPNHPSAMGVQYFASLVKERSEGRIEVKIYYENELGTPKEILEQIQFGGIAMARVNVLELTQVVSSLQPYFKTQIHQDSEKMMEWVEEHHEILSDHCQMERMIPIVWYYPDMRCFYSDEVMIKQVVDMKEMKIKTTPSMIMRQVMESLECQSVEIINADTYKSLSSGYMDAGEATLGELVLSDYYSFINYVTLSEYISCPDVMVASSVEFSLLEIADRELISKCAKDTYEFQKDKIQELQKYWITQLEKDKQLFIEDQAFKSDMKTIFTLRKDVTLYE